MTITWVESVPSPSSAASTGDDELRAFQASVSSGLSPSYIWPGSGGGSTASAGVSQLGNARLATAGNSAVTGGYQDGFLLLNRNHISLHHIGSTWTAMLGHASMIDHLPGIGFTQASQVSSRWLTQSGSSNFSGLAAFGTFNTNFPIAYSTAPPFVHLSVNVNFPAAVGSQGCIALVSSITTGGFSSIYSAVAGAAGVNTVVINWESDGTVLL